MSRHTSRLIVLHTVDVHLDTAPCDRCAILSADHHFDTAIHLTAGMRPIVEIQIMLLYLLLEETLGHQ